MLPENRCFVPWHMDSAVVKEVRATVVVTYATKVLTMACISHERLNTVGCKDVQGRDEEIGREEVYE